MSITEKKIGYPGKGKPFKIILSPEAFTKHDIITMNGTTELEITKVYRYNWWRRFLVWCGYPKVKLFLGVKVKPIDNGKDNE